MAAKHRIRLLEEICDIVSDEMNARNMKLTERSFFMEEISEVEPLERRELLLDYLSNTVANLLIGVHDQARALAAALNADTSITPLILVRTILEYSYKITYLADREISSEERILRVLRLYFNDIRALEKLPEPLRLFSACRQATTVKQQANEWYLELTDLDLRQVSTQEILDAVWQSGLETWNYAGNGNPIYDKGYRIGSAFVHGNSWAINHYCLETMLISNNYITTPHLKEETIRNLLLIAAGCLMYSFGFACQLMDSLPVGTMNKLELKVDDIRRS